MTTPEPQEIERAVFLIHGLGRRAASMSPIARVLRPGLDTNLFGYASFTAPIEEHAARLADAFAAHPARQIDVVTHSMGAIVLRHLLAHGPHHWRHGSRIGHVAMIAPPSQGSAIARMLPTPPGPGVLDTLRRLGAGAPAPGWTGEALSLTVIAGAAGHPGGFNPLLEGDDDGTVRVAETPLPGMTRLVLIGPETPWPRKAMALHSLLPANPDVARVVRDVLTRAPATVYATGADLVDDLGRPGPPSAIATRPRARTIQPRRTCR